MSHEPQITEIAAVLARHIRSDGVDPGAAKETWRHALRFARRTGAIGDIARKIADADPDNESLQAVSAEVTR